MKLFSKPCRAMAIAACLWPALAPAQDADPGHAHAAHPHAAANPDARVPAVVYQSVFVNLPAGVVQDSIRWSDANAAVAQFPRGHADLVKWEARQAGSLATSPGAPATPKSIADHDHSTLGRP